MLRVPDILRSGYTGSNLLPSDISNTGGYLGDFLIIVTWYSSTDLLVTAPLTTSLVWLLLFVVPCIDLGIFIFLGSFTLSVNNKKSSSIFIPVIILVEKFKTLFFEGVTLAIKKGWPVK